MSRGSSSSATVRVASRPPQSPMTCPTSSDVSDGSRWRRPRRVRGTNRSTQRGKYQPARPLPSWSSHGQTSDGDAASVNSRAIETRPFDKLKDRSLLEGVLGLLDRVVHVVDLRLIGGEIALLEGVLGVVVRRRRLRQVLARGL